MNFVSYNTTNSVPIYQDQIGLYLNNGNYETIGMAFSESFSMYATKNFSASQCDIRIGTLGRTNLTRKSRNQIYGLTMRDYNSSSAKIYYSVNCSGSVCLNTEVVTSTYDVLASRNYSIGHIDWNCANQIEVNENIVVLSCTTSTYGIISIYRESDMYLYKNLFRHEGFAGVPSQIGIISSQYTHQIYYNSFNSTSLEDGKISVIEFVMNPNNTDLRNNFTTVSFQAGGSDDTGYGSHFYIDQSNTSCSTSSGDTGCEQYKMYIGNMNPDTNNRQAFDALQICMYGQVYNASSDTCYSAGDNLFSSDIQQETAHNCSTYNDTNAKSRAVGESLCDFGCSSYQFGKNCESCSVYMERVEQTPFVYNRFDDSNSNYCGEVYDPQYCERETECAKCEYKNG